MEVRLLRAEQRTHMDGGEFPAILHMLLHMLLHGDECSSNGGSFDIDRKLSFQSNQAKQIEFEA